MSVVSTNDQAQVTGTQRLAAVLKVLAKDKRTWAFVAAVAAAAGVAGSAELAATLQALVGALLAQ